MDSTGRFKLSLLLLFTLMCVNPSDKNGNCGSPTIHSCGGSQCVYSHIYDAYGNFINEAASNMGYVYWDGRDCHGDSVGCGKYRVEHHSVVSGFERVVTEYIIIKDENSTSACGRSACDSLKKECPGGYAEALSSYIGSDGSIHSDEVCCICCQ